MRFRTSIILSLLVFLVTTARGAEIHNVVRRNDLAKTKQILKANPKAINARQQQGYTPLHLAIHRPRLQGPRSRPSQP